MEATAKTETPVKTGTSVKTYVLLGATNPSAPIYTQVSKDQKIKHNKIPSARAYLQQTFTDKDGINKTARLKLNANSIWLDEQIKAGIPANEKFTKAERNAVHFRYGALHTKHAIVQTFLETVPQFNEFVGFAPNGEKPLYELYNKAAEVRTQNTGFKKMLLAGNIIHEMNLEQARAALVAIRGSFFTAPASGDDDADLMDAQNILVDEIEASAEAMEKIIAMKPEVSATSPEGGSDKVKAPVVNLKKEDELKVLLQKVISGGIISFDIFPDKVAKKVNNKWVGVKDVVKDYTPEQKVTVFSEYLLSDEGKQLHEDLKKDAEKLKSAENK